MIISRMDEGNNYNNNENMSNIIVSINIVKIIVIVTKNNKSIFVHSISNLTKLCNL